MPRVVSKKTISQRYVLYFNDIRHVCRQRLSSHAVDNAASKPKNGVQYEKGPQIKHLHTKCWRKKTSLYLAVTIALSYEKGLYMCRSVTKLLQSIIVTIT